LPFLDPPAIQRTFTLDQANAALPLVEAILRDVMRQERRVRHLRFRLKFIRRGGADLLNMFAREIEALERDLQAAEEDLDRYVDELLDLGIEPESLGLGLVDFPSEQQGETILLCWRYGESSIEYWHSLTGGFPDRSPLTPRLRVVCA
jgi:hypothetical protein